ncbi:MAG: TetR/AcrR family transcriptional regulator [Spirochaetia bacterium]|nr:TetR/AcrR family transcriptional regulator [Spirochaetia bacterium]
MHVLTGDNTETLTIRQKEIIFESIKLISEKGVQALTIKNIASAISVTERAIYRHFKSKNEIIKTIICEFRNTMFQMKKKLEEEENTPLRSVIRFIEIHFEGFMKQPYMTSLLFSEEMFRNEDSLPEYMKSMFQMAKKQLAELIKKGQGIDEIRKDIPAENMAPIILGTIRFQILQWHLNRYQTNLSKDAKPIKEAIKDLLKK